MLEMVVIDRSNTVKLELEVTSLDCHRLQDAIETALTDARIHKDWCQANGLWAAANLTWTAQIEVLERLHKETTEALARLS